MQVLQCDNINSSLGTDGSGAQYKFWTDSRTLVKFNTRSKEAQKEVAAYKLGTAFGLPCVPYTEIDALVNGKTHRACLSPSFLVDGDVEMTANELLDSAGYYPTQNVSSIEYINRLISIISGYTGIATGFVQSWLYDMLVFDYLICNSDRHLNNFEVLYNQHTGTYRLAPYFDHGLSFLGTDASLTKSEFEKRVCRYKSKPFSTNSDKNIGDLSIARLSFKKMLGNIGGIAGIRALDISDGYKLTVIRRSEQLNKLLS